MGNIFQFGGEIDKNFPVGNNLLDKSQNTIYFSRPGKIAMTPLEIGRIIRTARKDAGLLQDELAAAAGVGTRFVVEIENGKSSAQIGKVLAVLDALGCRVSLEPPPAGPGRT
jgi:y4mF family transcriptional regulator